MKPVSSNLTRATRALASVLCVALAACGESTPEKTPAPQDAQAEAAQGPAQSEPTPTHHLTQQNVQQLVLIAIRDGDLTSLRTLELPPRVDRMAVGVQLLSDTLRSVENDSVSPDDRKSLDALFSALTALQAGSGGVGREALDEHLPQWRAWTAQQIERTRVGAVWHAKLRDYLTRFPLPDGELMAIAPDTPAAPGCPFAAAAPLVPALRLAATSGPDKLPPAFFKHVQATLSGYRGIGWAAGFGQLVDDWINGLREPRWRGASARVQLGDLCAAAYDTSGAPVQHAAVYTRRAGDMLLGALGKPTAKLMQTAAGAAELAVRLLEACKARGEERLMASWVAARARFAARDFDQAAEHAAVARRAFDEDGPSSAAAVGAPVMIASIEVTSLTRDGQFDRAVQVATDAYALPLPAQPPVGHEQYRARIAEAAAKAALAVQVYDQALIWLDRAAQQPSGQPSTAQSRGEAALARVTAIDAALHVGDAESAQRLTSLKTEIAKGTLPAQVAVALGDVLFDHDRVDEAEAVLRSVSGAPPHVRDYLHARLAAARGDAAKARRSFESALSALTKNRPGRLGELVARVVTKWADFEEREGNLPMAAWLAFRAVFHLEGTGNPAQLHKAYLQLLRLQRRRLEFSEARVALEGLQRLNLPISHPGAREARVDEFLVALEVTLASPVPVDPEIAEAALVNLANERLEEGRQRQELIALATALVRDEPEGLASPTEVAERSHRELLLAALSNLVRASQEMPVPQLVASALDLGRKAGSKEPEICRILAQFVLRRLLPAGPPRTFDPRKDERSNGVTPSEFLQLLDLRRGDGSVTTVSSATVVATLGEHDALRVIEPLGDRTLHLTLTRTTGELRQVPPQSELLAYRAEVVDIRARAPRNKPSWTRLSAKAKAAYDAVVASLPTGTERLTLILGKPIGALPLELGRPVDGSGPVLWFVRSLSELQDAAERDEPKSLESIDFQDSPLRSRHGAIALAPFNEADLEAFKASVNSAANDDVSVPQAFLSARDALRAEWKPVGPVRIPFWAAFVLRGTP